MLRPSRQCRNMDPSSALLQVARSKRKRRARAGSGVSTNFKNDLKLNLGQAKRTQRPGESFPSHHTEASPTDLQTKAAAPSLNQKSNGNPMIRLSRCRSLATTLARSGGSSSSLSRQAGRWIASAVTHDIFFHPSLHHTPNSNVSLRSLSAAVQEADSVSSYAPRSFEKLLAANRGEIATRILRAGTELGCSTVALYSHEGMPLLCWVQHLSVPYGSNTKLVIVHT